MDYYSLTNWVVWGVFGGEGCFVFLQKAPENSYDIEVEQQVRNQGTDCMLAIISALETKKKNTFNKKTGIKCARTLNLRAWDSG